MNTHAHTQNKSKWNARLSIQSEMMLVVNKFSVIHWVAGVNSFKMRYIYTVYAIVSNKIDATFMQPRSILMSVSSTF